MGGAADFGFVVSSVTSVDKIGDLSGGGACKTRGFAEKTIGLPLLRSANYDLCGRHSAIVIDAGKFDEGQAQRVVS